METNYVMLGDGRWLCLESTVMDTDVSQCLHFGIREFFEALNMKIEKEFPLLLAEQQALNKVKEDETIVSTLPYSNFVLAGFVSLTMFFSICRTIIMRW